MTTRSAKALALAGALAGALAACGHHGGGGPTPGAASGSGIASGAADSPPTPADACAALDQRYDDVLAHAPGTCTTAADCACYPGGLGAHPTCGGVTDGATATALAAIANDFHRQGCRMTLQCAASICTTACDHGRCAAK